MALVVLGTMAHFCNKAVLLLSGCDSDDERTNQHREILVALGETNKS